MTAQHRQLMTQEQNLELLRATRPRQQPHLELAAVEAGMRTLWSDGLVKAEEGITSLEELRRVLAA